MGVFTVPIEIGDPTGANFERIDALLDTSMTFMMVPRSLLDNLGIAARWGQTFELADGTVQQFDMTETKVRLCNVTVTTLIVFDEEGSTPLLGRYTLTDLGLAVDPVSRRLVELIGRL